MQTPHSATDRPLAPRLSVYRWRPPMIASLLHRASGIALVALWPLYLWLLHRMVASPAAFAEAAAWLRAPLGKAALAIGGAALIYHYANGIRFLLLDGGIGESRAAMRAGARLALAVGGAGALLWLGVVL